MPGPEPEGRRPGPFLKPAPWRPGAGSAIARAFQPFGIQEVFRVELLVDRLTEDPVEQRQLVRRSGLTLFHINDSFPGTALGKNRWVEWVYSVLCEKKFGELEDVYRQLSGTATLKQLQEVAPSIV